FGPASSVDKIIRSVMTMSMMTYLTNDRQIRVADVNWRAKTCGTEESIDAGWLRWEYCRPKGDRNAPILNASCLFGGGLGGSGEESTGPHADRAPANREHGRQDSELLVQLWWV